MEKKLYKISGYSTVVNYVWMRKRARQLLNEAQITEENRMLISMDTIMYSAFAVEAFLNHIHPDDIDLVNNSYMSSLEAKQGYYVEHRIIRENGDVGYVEERCEHEFDINGNVSRSIGTVHDITKQKIAQNVLFDR